VIAVDTNILIYAHRREFAEHEAARQLLLALADGPELWGIPVFCLGEFLRVATHPAILQPPSSLKAALDALEALFESSSLRVLMPEEQFPRILLRTVAQAKAIGNLAFDAQIAALCHEHGIRVLWSNDRDFALFAGIEARPLAV